MGGGYYSQKKDENRNGIDWLGLGTLSLIHSLILTSQSLIHSLTSHSLIHSFSSLLLIHSLTPFLLSHSLSSLSLLFFSLTHLNMASNPWVGLKSFSSLSLT